MKKLVVVFVVMAVSGCISGENVENACVSLCKSYDGDLSNGPCLSDDNPEWDIDDWVCDVAHNPREDVDNLPENQCKEYREGYAKHFVEVDENCKVIRVR